MKILGYVFFLSALIFGLSGCLRTRAELGDTRSRQEAQSQQIAAQKEMQQIESAEQMRQLNGRIDSLENQLSQVLQQLQNQNAQKVGEQDMATHRIKLMEQAIAKMDLQILALSNEFKVYVKKKPQKGTRKKSAKKGNFGQAEDFFNKKNWKQAIVGYEKYRKLNPKGRRYSTATYKIGVCFQELKMDDAAKSFYQEVLEKFAKTAVAKKAKYRLSKLK